MHITNAPTDIQINDTVFINGKVVFTNDKGANFLLGTLSAAETSVLVISGGRT
jgi:hypothetical protein